MYVCMYVGLRTRHERRLLIAQAPNTGALILVLPYLVRLAHLRGTGAFGSAALPRERISAADGFLPACGCASWPAITHRHQISVRASYGWDVAISTNRNGQAQVPMFECGQVLTRRKLMLRGTSSHPGKQRMLVKGRFFQPTRQ